jgi:hypothetical protein
MGAYDCLSVRMMLATRAAGIARWRRYAEEREAADRELAGLIRRSGKYMDFWSTHHWGPIGRK